MTCQPGPKTNCLGCAQGAVGQAKEILQKYQVPRADPLADFVPNRQLEEDIERMLRSLR
jgi:hypothetical protein